MNYCNKYNVTLSSVTPSILKKILRVEREIPKCIETITIGGEQADLEDIEALRKRFDGNICLTYGLSEAGPRVFTNVVSEDRVDWYNMGEPLDQVKVDLYNPVNEDEYEMGELIVSTPTVMLGYLQDGKIERKGDFINEWLRTGDVCKRKIGEEKYFYLERRILSRAMRKIFIPL